ncbi:hypothetical protein JCM3770_005092 [Rhodotorula araucariae]
MKLLTAAGRALALLGGATVALAAWDCTLQLGSSRFDLAQVQGIHSWETETQTPPTVTKARYALSLCSALPDPSSSAPDDDCPPGTRLCMRTFSARTGLEDRLLSVVPVAGELDGSDLAPRAVEQEGEKPDQVWVLELGGGKYNGVEQKARIEMRCDDGAKETTPAVTDYDPKAGLLTLNWRTSAACPTASNEEPAPPPPKEDDTKDGGSRGSSTGIGFFGWFFTLLFLALLGYFVIGAYHNYTTYGATGWDMVPHRDIWRDLPFVVSDLFKGRGGSRNGYSALG